MTAKSSKVSYGGSSLCIAIAFQLNCSLNGAEKDIGGIAFKLISEDKWKTFGLSEVGLILVREHIEKKVSAM